MTGLSKMLFCIAVPTLNNCLVVLGFFLKEFTGAHCYFFFKREGKNFNGENMFISFYYCLLVEVLRGLHHGELFQKERRHVFGAVFSAIASGYR